MSGIRNLIALPVKINGSLIDIVSIDNNIALDTNGNKYHSAPIGAPELFHGPARFERERMLRALLDEAPKNASGVYIGQQHQYDSNPVLEVTSVQFYELYHKLF